MFFIIKKIWRFHIARLIRTAICLTVLVITSISLASGEAVELAFGVHALRIKDSITSKLSNKAHWAFVTADVESGRIIANLHNVGNASFTPGSLMKLFVTAAVLERNHRETIDISTVIAADGKISKGKLKGDLALKGGGDPFLSINDLLNGIEKIKLRGIKEIEGNILVDDSFFDIKGWKSRYNGPAYGSPSALGLDLHTVSITADGSQQRVVINPPNDAVRVSFNPFGKAGIRQIDDPTYEVTGAVKDAAVVRNRFSLADPALYVGGVFMTLLKQSGIRVAGSVKRRLSPSPQPSPQIGEGKKGESEAGIKEIARIGARDINAIVRDTNQHSLNVAADNMLFLLGALTYGEAGTKEKGIRAVKDFLHEIGVPLEGLAIDDGSGVSELNRVSADQMIAFLLAVSKRPWFSVFYDSLERPGIDGRLKDFEFKSDRMRVKPGQLPDAYCLAGYIESRNGKKTAFAFMVNGSGPDISQGAPAVAVEALRILEEN